MRKQQGNPAWFPTSWRSPGVVSSGRVVVAVDPGATSGVAILLPGDTQVKAYSFSLKFKYPCTPESVQAGAERIKQTLDALGCGNMPIKYVAEKMIAVVDRVAEANSVLLVARLEGQLCQALCPDDVKLYPASVWRSVIMAAGCERAGAEARARQWAGETFGQAVNVHESEALALGCYALVNQPREEAKSTIEPEILKAFDGRKKRRSRRIKVNG